MSTTPHTETGWVTLDRCPVCGATERRRWRRHDLLNLWRCGSCTLVYSDPQPQGLVADKYLNQYDLAEHFGAREGRKAVLYDRRLELLEHPTPGAARLCDVGCGDGQFLSMARDEGWEATGIELNPPAAERVRGRGIEVFEGWFEEMEDLPWGTFDLVTSWDCIEHTAHPAEFARRLARLLRPGGTLALTTLNVEALVAKAFRGHWSMVVEDHYTYWNEPSMRRVLNDAGLEVESYTTYGLGRDFVTWADALARRTPWRRTPSPAENGHPASSANVAAAAPTPAGAVQRTSWDAKGPILALERGANRALEGLSAGVGCTVLATLPR